MMPAALDPAATLIGRDGALATIVTALDVASAGRGGIVLVGGEAGIGKTRLADHVSRIAAARGMRTVWGRSTGLPDAPAYWLWTQALGSALRALPADAAAHVLGSGDEPVRRLLPEFDAESHQPPVAADPAPDQARFRLFTSIAACLRCLATLPVAEPADGCAPSASAPGLLVVLDDIDQADDASLALLTFVAHAIDAAPIVILCTFREGSVSPRSGLTEPLTELARVRTARRLTLGPLHAGETAALLTHLLGGSCPPALAGALHDHTGGNPLFLTETARVLADRPIDAALPVLPAVVREAVRVRVGRLGPDCGVALDAAAVLGREFDVAVLGRVSGLAVDALLEALEQAERAHLIAGVEGEPGRFRFGHAVTRDTLYEALPAARRVRLHRAAGEAIEEHCAARPEAQAAALAYHYFQALPTGAGQRALLHAERAARQAASIYAYEEAARLFDIALRALDATAPGEQVHRFDLLLALGRALERAGQHERGCDRLLEAVDVARRLESSERVVEAALAFEHRISYDAKSLALFEEALLAVPSEERVLRLRLLVRAAGVRPLRDASREHLEEANSIARRLTDPRAAALAGVVAYQAGWRADNLAERLDVGADLVQTARTLNDRELEFFALWMRAVDLMELGDRPQIDRAVAAVGGSARDSHQAMQLWIATILETTLATLDGRLDAAERLAHEAAVLGRGHDPVNAPIWFATQMSLIRAHQGRPPVVDELHRTLARPMRGLQTAAALILALIDLGRRDDARALFDRYASGFAEIPANYLRLGALTMFGLACAALGDTQNAGLLYELLQPFTGHHAVMGLGIGLLGTVDRALAVLAATMRRWELASSHFEIALAANERLGARAWVARTQVAYAAMLLERGTSGDLEDAADLATQALAAAETLGMHGVGGDAHAVLERVERARQIASTLRGRRAPPGLTPDGLTPREVEVLALLAAGHTSKEIADQLVLSTFTIARHITKIYTKIGARGRADATAYAIAHGLVSSPH